MTNILDKNSFRKTLQILRKINLYFFKTNFNDRGQQHHLTLKKNFKKNSEILCMMINDAPLVINDSLLWCRNFQFVGVLVKSNGVRITHF